MAPPRVSVPFFKESFTSGDRQANLDGQDAASSAQRFVSTRPAHNQLASHARRVYPPCKRQLRIFFIHFFGGPLPTRLGGNFLFIFCRYITRTLVFRWAICAYFFSSPNDARSHICRFFFARAHIVRGVSVRVGLTRVSRDLRHRRSQPSIGADRFV